MTTQTRLLTAEDLWNMPDSGGRNELVDGELLPMSPANSRHGNIIFRISRILDRFASSKKLGEFFAAETGFIVSRSPDSVLAPDVGFVVSSRIPASGLSDKFFDGTPDFALEVLSPRDTPRAVEMKARKFLQAGTQLIWAVNPKARSVTIYRPGPSSRELKEGDTITGEDIFPGFSCTVSDFFA